MRVSDFLRTLLALVVLTIVCAALSGFIYVSWYLTITVSWWIIILTIPLTYFCWWLIGMVFRDCNPFR